MNTTQKQVIRFGVGFSSTKKADSYEELRSSFLGEPKRIKKHMNEVEKLKKALRQIASDLTLGYVYDIKTDAQVWRDFIPNDLVLKIGEFAFKLGNDVPVPNWDKWCNTTSATK